MTAGLCVAALSSPAFAGLGAGPAVTTPSAAVSENLFDDPKLTREMGLPHITVGGGAGVGHAPPSAPAPSSMVASATMARVASPRTSVSNSQPAAGASLSARPVAGSTPAAVVVLPSPVSAPPSATPVTPARAVMQAPAALPFASAPPPRTPIATSHPVRKIAPTRLALADTGAATETADAVDVSQTRKVPAEATPAAVESPSGSWPYAPRMKLGYRRFPFTRVGSTTPSIIAGTLDPNRPEAFESLSLDLYPISWYLRMGLSTQFGWESGQFDRSGDYFFAESASLGFQLPGRFTPFAEGLAGAGYMRRVQGSSTLPGGYWQVGVDVGVEIYFAARAYVSVAGGYLHPGNLFVMDQNLQSIKMDTWSLKVGLGI